MTELSPGTLRIIAAGRAALSPSAGDRERLRRQVFFAAGALAATGPLVSGTASGAATAGLSSGLGATSGAAGGAGISSGLATATGTTASGGLKLLLVSLAVAGAAGGGYVGMNALGGSGSERSAAIDEARPGARTREVPQVVVSPIAPEAPEVNEAPAPSRKRVATRPRHHAVAHAAVDAAAGQAVPVDEPSVEPAPVAEPATGEDGAAEAGANGENEESSAIDDALGRELALLDRARAANAACHTGRALSILARYERDYPSGQLAPEAAFLRVVIMCRAGQEGLARTQAHALGRRWPSSPLASRALLVCDLPEAKEKCDETD